MGGGITRLGPPSFTNANGDASRLLDFTVAPTDAILPRSTGDFRFWYRDPSGGPAGFNASDALSVRFLP